VSTADLDEVTGQLLALAAVAALALGPGWTAGAGPNPHGALLRHADGRQLHVWQDHRDRAAGRVQVNGVYPGGWACAPSDEKRIRVRASRGGTALAGDIRWRLLPRYEADLAVARVKAAGAERDRAARDAACAAVMAAVPGADLAAVRPGSGLRVQLPGGRYRRREAVVSADGARVTLQLPDLGLQEAVGVLRCLYGGESLPGLPAAACGPAGRSGRESHGRLRRAGRMVLLALTW
jgi:hypothetical protein